MEQPETPKARAADSPPPGPPHRVRLPVNVHEWRSISFLHWRVDPAVMQQLVPRGLEVLIHDASAWVSVTPFVIRVRPPGLPAVSGLATFPETNVRTYVAGPDGRQGLWFLRMEVTQAWFVAALRAVGLPYVRQRMSVTADGGAITYVSQPRAGGAPGHRIVVRPGQALSPPSGGPTARFLTARWAAYHRRGRILLRTPAEHPPWPLQTAAVEDCAVAGLFAAAGLPAPQARPALAHYSPGVRVRIGPPARV